MAQRSRIRRSVVVFLTILGCLLSVVSLVTVWGRDQILDTDRYLANVVPLASDPVIQDEVADKVATAINSRLDAADRARDVLPAAAGFLAPVMGDAVEQLVERKSVEFTHSLAFRTLWLELNRAGHEQIVSVLTGSGPAALNVSDGRLMLDLSPVVEAVREKLVLEGLAIVATLPPINLVVDVADAQGLEQARVFARRLDLLATILPILSVFVLLAAVALSRHRRSSAVRVAVGLAWSMVLTRLLLAWGSRLAVDNVPASVASPPAVRAYYSHLTALLHRGAILIGLVAVVIGVALLVVGPIIVAVRRHSWGREFVTAMRPDLGPALALLAAFVLLVWPSLTSLTALLVVALSVALRLLLRRWGPVVPAPPMVEAA